ncbi:MAG: acyl-CoA dehydrogenase [Acidimicrobiaceae bacterium]|nr:acyl-CoA dehydrogenase [Acidimicrobiaceae bacterium]
MDRELRADQIDRMDNVRAVLARECPASVVRGVYEGTDDASALWKQMVELGWPALCVPEQFGGLGMGFVELGILAEELGRVSAPTPLLATVTQFAPLLVEVHRSAPSTEIGDLLADVVAGTRTGSLAFAENGRWSPGSINATASGEGDSLTVTGEKTAVLAGSEVDSFVVVARLPGSEQSHHLGAFLVKRADAEATTPPVIDPALGLADVRFDAAPATVLSAGDAGTEIARAAEQAVVAMALHTVGACRRIFEVTLEYAKVREQYDRVIGSFQALKHRFADMYLAVEKANAICYFAALAIAEDDARRSEASHVAKVSSGDCQRLLAEEGLQLHGGIGYTWENDLHFLLKRAKVGDVLCGSASWHRTRLAELLGLSAVVAS